ncbi:MAG TPA: hypothetical protein P5157_00265 [Paludibacteraceae bacterium]|nr:hypothetical protein [Paludibacteraceae bacterium]HPQ11965.1 hypothetical protein [Paludibacteraceae bacterium]HRS23317.1 hypothetical protein [Paludibacteraceae bacterium]
MPSPAKRTTWPGGYAEQKGKNMGIAQKFYFYLSRCMQRLY